MALNLKSLANRFRKLARQIGNSIAFYPALIAILWLLLAVLILTLENNGLSKNLLENLPYLVVNNEDTARTILTTFIGGIITLAVFSFSMVMIVLNQASSLYSPRLLPGITTDKNNQIVLGVYLGTIIYCTVVLRNIQPDSSYYKLPGFSIMVAIISALICLVLFVYFIHNISQKLRIENILHDIYQTFSKKISALKKLQSESVEIANATDLNHKVKLTSEQYGYYQNINSEVITEEFSEYDELTIEILPARGTFIFQNEEVIGTSKENQSWLTDRIEDIFYLDETPYGTKNLDDGFQQVTEIIVKALSPGINDPGTAIDAIDTMTKLLGMRLALKDSWAEGKSNGKVTIIHHLKTFEKLLFEILAQVRNYGKSDVLVVIKLIHMLSFLARHKDCTPSYRQTIEKELEVLLEDASTAIKMERDLEQIEKARALFV